MKKRFMNKITKRKMKEIDVKKASKNEKRSKGKIALYIVQIGILEEKPNSPSSLSSSDAVKYEARGQYKESTIHAYKQTKTTCKSRAICTRLREWMNFSNRN